MNATEFIQLICWKHLIFFQKKMFHVHNDHNPDINDITVIFRHTQFCDVSYKSFDSFPESLEKRTQKLCEQFPFLQSSFNFYDL